MPIPLVPLHAHVRQGAYLPHWTLPAAIYHVVFRLGDSLPATVVARFRAERETLLAVARRGDLSPDELASSIRRAFSQRIDSCLDNGLGARWLAREGVPALVAETLQYFSSNRHSLHAWCIMPNHVHVIVQPLGGYELKKILKSWKGFSARMANRMLFRSGEFWQPESYDHLIREDAELAQTISYVQANPEKAGLRNWNWVWPPLA